MECFRGRLGEVEKWRGRFNEMYGLLREKRRKAHFDAAGVACGECNGVAESIYDRLYEAMKAREELVDAGREDFKESVIDLGIAVGGREKFGAARSAMKEEVYAMLVEKLMERGAQ